jgi:hypothetical protein
LLTGIVQIITSQPAATTMMLLPAPQMLQELEDMLLRYERQLKAEILARQKAEHGLAAALAAVAAARQQSDSHGCTARRDPASLAAEQDAMQQVSMVHAEECMCSCFTSLPAVPVLQICCGGCVATCMMQ